MSKDIKPSQLKPGKRYCFKQPNPTLALSESKKMFFAVTDSSKLGGTVSVNLSEPVVFITILKEKYGVPYYLFLLSNGSIGRLSDSILEFQLQNKALKIFKVDK